MNTLEIVNFILKDDEAKKYFIGVFAKDELPKTINYPASLILNSHESDKPGEHWMAIFYDQVGKAEFFDSYGIHPEFYNLTNYLNSTSNSWTWNKKCVQGIFSNYCGYYCILFLLFKSRNYSLDYFLKFFNSNTSFNDKLIQKLIE